VPPTPPTAPNRRPYSLGLTREQVIDAAAGLIDEHGIDALSMRKLAKALGVGAMSIYTYVQTKEDVLGEVAGRHLSRLHLPAPDAAWPDALIQTYLDLHALMIENPILAHVLTSQPVDSLPAHRMAEVVLTLLAHHGFHTESAVDLFVALGSLTTGYALNENARIHHTGPTPEQRLDRITSLSDDEYPALRAAAPTLVRWRADSLRETLHRLITTHPKH
jgi:AcrR family transcriptional regulator